MRVLILGAGYAGVTVARRLESMLPPEVELVVVDESESHLVKHEVHRVIRRPSVSEAIRVPLSDLFDRASIRTARVAAVDREARAVHLENGETLSYDYAAVCLGSETADYGIPGVAEHGLPLTSVDDALEINEAFREAAARAGESDVAESDTDSGGVDVVVGGAGLSGIQTAGELAAFAREEAVDADVMLIEQERRVAPNFPANFQTAVRSALESAGVSIETGTTVERATESAVETDRGTFPADVFVWAGGIAGTDAMGGDRPIVQSDLRIDERTFAVGDAGRGVDADGEPIPASASAALREARTVADNIARLVDHERSNSDGFTPRLDPYRFEVPGWIVSVGDQTVAQLGPEVVTGAAAKAMKTAVGAGHLSSVGAIRNAAELAEAELRA
ncbi:NAD(P)/FAD-dependent oxidoreductase [Halobellus clavatus]|uniref:NADH dehydrogenase n=1 Tax=Halobellus clavatus TaxID=660517 RepID=A0A1H3KS40_9EURY|nr:FAD-dependent oxidoreductase [Halobellus clavatus]SDY54475.1 NADH dehydrogenase [Halobellus clavatus]